MEFVVVQKGDGLEQLNPEASFRLAPGQEHLTTPAWISATPLLC